MNRRGKWCHLSDFMLLRAALPGLAKQNSPLWGITTPLRFERLVGGFSECARQFPQYSLQTVLDVGTGRAHEMTESKVKASRQPA